MKTRKFSKVLLIAAMISVCILTQILFPPIDDVNEESQSDGDTRDDDTSQTLPQEPPIYTAPDFNLPDINERRDTYTPLTISPAESEDLLTSDTSITDNTSLQYEYYGITMREGETNQILEYRSYTAYRLPNFMSAGLFPKEVYTMVKFNSDGVVWLKNLPDYEQAEHVIKKYINELRNADILRQNGLVSEYEGMGQQTGIETLPIEDRPDPSHEMTEKGLLNPPKVFMLDEMGRSRMERRRDLIIDHFGEAAFDNVEYVLFYQLGTEGHEVVILKSTLEILSEEELANLTKKFFTAIALREGIEYEKIFDKDKGVDLSNEYISKYIKEVPWVHTTLPHYLIIRVYLSFDGMASSSKGFEQFSFSIHNAAGKWEILDGLCWVTEGYLTD